MHNRKDTKRTTTIKNMSGHEIQTNLPVVSTSICILDDNVVILFNTRTNYTIYYTNINANSTNLLKTLVLPTEETEEKNNR